MPSRTWNVRSFDGPKAPHGVPAPALVVLGLLFGLPSLAPAQGSPTPLSDALTLPAHIQITAWENHPSQWHRLLPASVQGDAGLTVQILVRPTSGSVEIDPSDPLAVRYLPRPRSTADDSFRVRVCDPVTTCSTPAQVAVKMDVLNAPPSASPVAIATTEDTPSPWVPVPLHDANPGDRHSLVITGESALGTAQVDKTSIRFVPAQNLNGDDEFSFRVCDDKGACSADTRATVRVDPVQDPPIAPSLSIVTEQGMASDFVDPPIVDPDAQDLHTLQILSQPQGGYAEATAMGIRVVPDPGFHGESEFQYRVCDDTGLCSDPARAALSVTRRNTTPRIAPIALSLDEDVGTDPIAPLIDDPDPDEHHRLEVQSAPMHGRIEVSAATFQYHPAPNWFGTDTAVLRVCDSLSACSEAAIEFVVKPIDDAPVIAPLRIRTKEDIPSAPRALVITDIDSSAPATLSIIQGNGGEASISADAVTFMPAPNFAGATAFTLRACDETMACSTLEVPVAVEYINDPPRLDPITLTLEEDAESAPLQVVFSDADALDTHTLAISQEPRRGSARILPSGMQVVYRAQPDFNGTDDFALEICDQSGACSEAGVAVTVTPVNDAPTALELAIVTPQDSPSEWVVPTVSDPDEADVHILRVLAQPPSARVEVNPTRDALRALPEPGASGLEIFQIEACDLHGACLSTDASLDIIRTQPLGPRGAPIRVPLVSHPASETNAGTRVRSEPIVLQDGVGSIVQGVLGVRVALGADAPCAYVVHGVRVEPGQEASIGGFDFTAGAGRLDLTLRPATLEGVASGYGGTLRVSVDDPYAPALHSEIALWDPLESIAVTAAKPAYARLVEPVVVSATPRGDVCPRGVVVYDASVQSDDDDPNRTDCALRWTTLPSGLAQSPAHTAPFLEGYFQGSAESESIGYEIGLLARTDDGQRVFRPAARAGRIEVSLSDPRPPELIFEPGDASAAQTPFLAYGRWIAPLGAGLPAGTIRADADYPDVQLRIESSVSGVMEEASPHAAATAPIKTALAGYADVERVRVRAHYVRAPSISSETELEFSQRLDAPSLRLLSPSRLTNTEPVTIHGTLAGVTPDQALSNTGWSVRLFRINADASHEPISEEVPLADAQGRFALSTDALSAGLHPVIVVAQTASGEVAQSPTVHLRVEDATPIALDLRASRRDGVLPVTAVLTVAPEDLARVSDIASIQWEFSDDDGRTWAPLSLNLPRMRAFLYTDELTVPATRSYRASAINRHSGAQSVSNSVALTGYRLPDLVVSGFTETSVGDPVHWNARSAAGEPVQYAWSLTREPIDGDTPDLSGEDNTLSADVIGTTVAHVRARLLSSPDVPGAWRTISKTLTVKPPAMRPPVLHGPEQVDVGATATFSISTEHCIDPSVAARSPLAGRWIMPDGSIRQGTRVTYTGAAGDEERIRYEAWIDGYHAETARIVEQPVRIRTYTWPNWRLYSNILFPYTPARVAYELKPDGALDPRASTSVDWTLPPGAVLERDDGTQITLRFDTPGAWTVEGRVADTMGHSSALSETVEIQTAPPLSASLETAVVDSWSRAPADVITRWQVSGLLAGERIVQLSLRFNDAVVSQKLANALRTRVGEPGTYTVEVDLTSNAGRTVTASHVIELFAGDPPQCTIHVLGDAGRSLEAQAMCKAKTGMLTKYHWWIQYADADAPHDLGYRGSRIRLPASALARGIEAITLVGVNDLHQESEPFSWSPETEHEAPVEASP